MAYPSFHSLCEFSAQILQDALRLDLLQFPFENVLISLLVIQFGFGDLANRFVEQSTVHTYVIFFHVIDHVFLVTAAATLWNYIHIIEWIKITVSQSSLSLSLKFIVCCYILNPQFSSSWICLCVLPFCGVSCECFQCINEPRFPIMQALFSCFCA